MNNLYQEHILDHYHYPRQNGVLKNPTHSSDAKNISCGDSLHMDILVKDGIIKDIGWQGNGCAISQAAASILSEAMLGKSVETARAFASQDITRLLGLELSPNRLKCALLSLETLQRAVKSKLF